MRLPLPLGNRKSELANWPTSPFFALVGMFASVNIGRLRVTNRQLAVELLIKTSLNLPFALDQQMSFSLNRKAMQLL
jgi:hypothetical protein